MNAPVTIFTLIAALAVIALLAGGFTRLHRRQNRKHGVLMIAAALVLLGNVLIVMV
jgi:uncharacterized membrane protein YdcZ (DUF606 family)